MEQSTTQLPRWACHKEVYADRIVEISPNNYWKLAHGRIVMADEVKELSKRQVPIVGDYYVVYEDGYATWSPAKAFEEGYTRL